MGKKRKLFYYHLAKQSDYVIALPYENIKHFSLQGNWHKAYFHNQNKINLELGCGKGEYTIALAQKYPEQNFIGIDIKGDRIARGVIQAKEKNLKNVAFLRTRVENVTHAFAAGEVSDIWIVFPDPQPAKSQIKKRLTNPAFLEKYKKIMQNNARIHLKTDDINFYDYTLKVIHESGFRILQTQKDIYQNPVNEDIMEVKTFYEKKWIEEGRKINYLSFNF